MKTYTHIISKYIPHLIPINKKQKIKLYNEQEVIGMLNDLEEELKKKKGNDN